MKALKRAETAHEPAASAPGLAGADSPPIRASANIHRDSLWRATALWSVAALIVLGAAMYGYSLWQQPAPLVLTPAAAPISPTPVASGPAPSAVTPAAPVEAPPPVAQPAPSKSGEPTAPTTEATVRIVAPKTAGTPRSAIPETNPQIAIHQASDAASSTLQRAYQALRAGRNVQARTLYLDALATDSGVDALLGLAAIAANSGDSRQAAAYYREALVREPNNSAALAGIASLASSGDPQGAQKPLERMAEKTDSASVRAALGNVYASQSKWQAAQEAYFEAFRKEPDNANHAYNLAVSLDQLGERTLALEYYRKALDLGSRSASSFDAISIERRIAELKTAN